MKQIAEKIEIQRRSIAMLPPHSSVKIEMTLRREIAIDVLSYASVLMRVSGTSYEDEGEDQAVA